MIKRTSILVRRPQDDRASFTAHWSGTHGKLVAQLPDIARYIQNHVLEDLSLGLDGIGTYDIDGFVELYFADEHAMRTAFAGANAHPIWEDEPKFLEHSTAYQIAGDRAPHPELCDSKLILVAAGGPAAIEWCVDALRHSQIPSLDRNDVVEVIARATMARPPQIAGTFLHMRFTTTEAAQAGVARIAHALSDAKSHGIERLALTRVAEHRII